MGTATREAPSGSARAKPAEEPAAVPDGIASPGGEAVLRAEGVLEANGPAWLGVMRFKHYRRVIGASFVSNIGGWMEMVGIQMIVAKATGSLKMLGYFAAAQLLPILLIGIFGGLVADRVNRKKLLVVTQALLMVIAGAVAAASHWQADMPTIPWLGHLGEASGLVAALFILSILQGVVLAFNMPAWQVLTPRLVPRSELTKAINLNGISFNGARVVGPALAGVILGWIGATPLFVVNTLTFLGVLIAVSTTPDAPAPALPDAHPWRQVREACAFLFRQKGPFCVFMAMVLMSLLAAPLIRMMPLYVIDVFGMKDAAADSATGTLISVLGVGAVLGGLGLKFIPAWYPKHHFIPMALTGAGLTITAFGLTSSLWAGYVAMFFVGVFWIWGFNPAWAAMQNLVSDQMRGRVMALANVAAFGVTAAGNIASGWLGEGVQGLLASGRFGAYTAQQATVIGTHLAVAGLSVVLFIAGMVMLIWRVPEVDGLKPGDPEYGPKRRNLWDGITARAHRPRAVVADAAPAWEPQSGHAGAK